ncbi:MAG: DNA cytosine methyltransferase [Fibrobacterales bacterium]|nr:DNA cytosine methyltransferase [Fibrobacterales bacterium]
MNKRTVSKTMPKLRGISLFANVGVAEANLEKLGVDMRIANELLPDRAKFYQDVYPHTHMVCGDITDAKVRSSLVKEALEKDVNFVMATPPCQGMSRVGKMEELDERNHLVYYAVDVIKRIRPEYVLIENVTTILRTRIAVNGSVMLIPEYLRKELGGDYRFNKKTVVRAMDYSIPQIRHRNIYLLVRRDKNIEWEFPEPTRPVTLEDAIGDLPSVDPLLRDGIEETLRHFPDFEKKRKAAAKISKWHRPPVHSWRMVEWMMHTPTGESAIHNPIHYPRKTTGERVKAHYNQYRRLEWGKQARCLTQNNGVISSLACVHPGRPYKKNGELLYTEPRVFTIYEVMIISSLPRRWPIPAWANETLIRKVIGEGIPSHLIEVIVQALLKRIR